MIDERAYEFSLFDSSIALSLAISSFTCLRSPAFSSFARPSWQQSNSYALSSINELSTTVENNRKEMELMRKQLEAKDEVNMMLANEISNLRLQLEDGRKHRFGRTSEQRRLLNNRNIDKSAMEKSEYDGSGRKVMMIIRPMVTVPAAIPLPVTYLHRTAGLQGKRKLLPVQQRPG